MDVENIFPGDVFRPEIASAIEECNVFLAVIGPTWLTRCDRVIGPEHGNVPEDFVKLEIALALRSSKTRTIPVLVDGATLPSRAELDFEISGLVSRTAWTVSSDGWENDLRRVVIDHAPTKSVPREHGLQYPGMRYQILANADEHPFEAHAGALSRRNAWWLAEASLLAYQSNNDEISHILADRAKLRSAPLGLNDGFIAFCSDFAIVSFRGAKLSKWQDFLAADPPMTAWGVGHVNSVAARHFDSLHSSLQRALRRLTSGPVWVTGHGTGGTLASLAAVMFRDVVRGVCTFGSPSTGDARFCAHLSGSMGARAARYVNHDDWLPDVMSGTFYSDLARARWINEYGVIAHEGQISDRRSNGQQIANVTSLIGICSGKSDAFVAELGLPSCLSGHAAIHYGIQCWNDYVLNSE